MLTVIMNSIKAFIKPTYTDEEIQKVLDDLVSCGDVMSAKDANGETRYWLPEYWEITKQGRHSDGKGGL